MVFWQTARVAKQSRPAVRTPTARAAGLADLEIVVDSHEGYAWNFAGRQVHLSRRALPAGDYGVVLDDRLVGVVERKSLADLTSSLTSGKLGYALGELSSVPRAAVVVEDRYAAIFKQEHVRPAVVADGLAELQVRWPTVPIVFCDNRDLAQEWTYRFLAAAVKYAALDADAASVVGGQPESAPPAPEPSAAELRAWAKSVGLEVPDRGRIPASVRDAWRRRSA